MIDLSFMGMGVLNCREGGRGRQVKIFALMNDSLTC